MAENRANAGKIFLIILVIGLLAYLGYEIYSNQVLSQTNFLAQLTPLLFKNAAILAVLLFLLVYVVPPFNSTLGKMDAKVIVPAILIISVILALQIGQKEVYQVDMIKDFFVNAEGKFSFIPLVNAAILWIIGFVGLPLLGAKFKLATQGENGFQKAAFPVILLIVCLLLSQQVSVNQESGEHAYLWDQSTVTSIEKFALGERGGNYFGHTGVYQNENGKQRYGILVFQAENDKENKVYPLPMFLLVLMGLQMVSTNFILGKTPDEATKKMATFLAIILASFTASRGTSISLIVWLGYTAVVFMVQKPLHESFKDTPVVKRAPWLTWAGAILVADIVAEILSPDTVPPIIPGQGLLSKAIIVGIFALVVAVIWNRSVSAIHVCKTCGRKCDPSNPLCPNNACANHGQACEKLEGFDALSHRGASAAKGTGKWLGEKNRRRKEKKNRKKAVKELAS